MVENQTTTVLLRIRIADHPGALSAVTRRIGAVKGDLVGIEILERGPGWVIDELAVELPTSDLIELMVTEVGEEDDVEVQDVHPLVDTPFDPLLNAFEVAAIITGSEDPEELFTSLCAHTWRSVRSTWVCVVDESGAVLAKAGQVPHRGWLADFIAGGANEELDTMWMPLPSAGASLVMGRPGVAFQAKERQKAAALARTADSLHSRLRQQRRLRSLLCHPSLGSADPTALLNQL